MPPDHQNNASEGRCSSAATTHIYSLPWCGNYFSFVGYSRREATVPKRGSNCPRVTEIPPRGELLHLQTSEGSHAAKTGKAQLLLQRCEALAFGSRTFTTTTILYLSSSSRQVRLFA